MNSSSSYKEKSVKKNNASFFENKPDTYLTKINIEYIMNLFDSIKIQVAQTKDLSKISKIAIKSPNKNSKEIELNYPSFVKWEEKMSQPEIPGEKKYFNEFKKEKAYSNIEILKIIIQIFSELFLRSFSPSTDQVSPVTVFIKFVVKIISEIQLDITKFLKNKKFSKIPIEDIYDLKMLVFKNEIKEMLLSKLIYHHSDNFYTIINQINLKLATHRNGVFDPLSDSSSNMDFLRFQDPENLRAPKKQKKFHSPDLNNILRDCPKTNFHKINPLETPKKKSSSEIIMPQIKVKPKVIEKPSLFYFEDLFDSRGHSIHVELWNIKKPLFCFSSHENLKRVTKEIAKDIIKIIPKTFNLTEDAVLDLKLVLSDFGEFKHSLTAFYINLHSELNPLLEFLVNSSMTSKFYKSERDFSLNYGLFLFENAKVLGRLIFLQKDFNFQVKIKRMLENPFYESEIFNKEAINSRIKNRNINIFS
jgi:hypothetical protein